ncbi:ATP-binding cassette domain-containing protein [Halorhabdus rudnickae]|uniref:ATP-binding cassette domain-containing protein n=1 Tax=Halorhabdus rudnickae TaxID=1775544 RepID=UPI001FCEB930
MAAIETSELRKKYGVVCSRLGHRPPGRKGRDFRLSGPNGTGKSTPINIFLEFVHPTEGSATVLGIVTQELSKRQGL